MIAHALGMTNATAGAEAVCPRCGDTFTPKRTNQRYCIRSCQKAATRNAKRRPQRVDCSAAAQRRQEGRGKRIRGLSHAFYETPPAYRAEFLERLIVEARRLAETRRLVTAREYLRSWGRDEGTGRLHIAHVLDHYCQEVYGLRSYEAANPETVIPAEDDLAFPAEYFGPDQPPIYEDGSLNRRPCSWATRKTAAR
ncbi:hypothetical protein DC366_00860 [Pelagivirga sediminicola]|uniref:Uncharacterized protein n=1 Tax=Pelagivirga sediminicola TaxID=2170575 RepID=A0A2T7GAV0_9RHOB|nr:hypothetical protein DC366_00860 [Pelagivirga sediminicola]